MIKRVFILAVFFALFIQAFSQVYTNKVVGEKNIALKKKWNFIIGTQFQINRHIMVRAEYGFLGSRQQFIGGLQYRFGL